MKLYMADTILALAFGATLYGLALHERWRRWRS